MKLNLLQFIIFAFVSAWVFCDVFEFSRSESIALSSFTGFIAAYINNAHGKIWHVIKNIGK